MRTAPVHIDGRATSAYAYSVRRGAASDVGFSVLEGRTPASPDEVLIGPSLLDQLGRQVGDTVAISVGSTGERRPLTIVGTGLSPSANGEPFTASMALTPETMAQVMLDEGFREAALHLSPGISIDDVTGRLGTSLEVLTAEPPPEVANLGQVDGLTTMLAAFLALLSVAVVAHAIVESVRHRCTAFAVLRSLGFTPPPAACTSPATWPSRGRCWPSSSLPVSPWPPSSPPDRRGASPGPA